MSQEERVEVTRDAVVRLQDQREQKAVALQNVPLNCYHDVRATMISVEAQVRYIPSFLTYPY